MTPSVICGSDYDSLTLHPLPHPTPPHHPPITVLKIPPPESFFLKLKAIVSKSTILK